MSKKADLLKAVRDELKAKISAVANRVYIVVQDAEGNQLLPMETECPMITVADMGLAIDWLPGQVGNAAYRVRARAHIQDLRDIQTPVIGHTATGSKGTAQLQGEITAALQGNLMAARIAGVELAQVEAEPPVDYIADESWFAVIGDVLLRYEMTET